MYTRVCVYVTFCVSTRVWSVLPSKKLLDSPVTIYTLKVSVKSGILKFPDISDLLLYGSGWNGRRVGVPGPRLSSTPCTGPGRERTGLTTP